MSVPSTINLLFDALCAANGAWREMAEPRTYSEGDAIVTVFMPPRYVFFPTEGMVSAYIGNTDVDLPRIQVAMLGRWDVVGGKALLTASALSIEAEADLVTRGFQVPAAEARALVRVCPRSREIIDRYEEHHVFQIGRSTALAAAADVPKRVAHWLLDARLCLGEDVMPFTHKFIAEHLNVRRASVSEVMKDWVENGVLRKDGNGRYDIASLPGLRAIAGIEEREDVPTFDRLTRLILDMIKLSQARAA